ncbi:MAG: TRAP transporter substrate-binding protein DctP [Longimicrobiales bacterium]|nr:TRAP transporter substrate-binding protein DctP [Longimicrobiales bacterium]
MPPEERPPESGPPTWSRRRVLASLLGIGALAPFLEGDRTRSGDDIVLRYTAHIPNSHGLYGRVFLPWEDMCTERTGGRIRWEHYVDRLLHGALDGFKAIESGITDYTHAYATYQPGSFHLTHGLQLPFLFSNPGVASLVSEELYPGFWKSEYERMGVYLAHCDATSAYDIISKQPIRMPEDIEGLKVRSTGGLMADIIRQMGAIPVVIAAAETYTAFQRGIIDVVALGAPDMAAYRLYETGTHYLRLGLTHTVLQYALNPRTFESLPEELQRELYHTFRFRGQIAHQNYYGSGAMERALETLREGGVEISEPTPDERQAWIEAVRPLEDRFIEENEGRGLPAEDFVREARRRAAKYEGWSDQDLWDQVAENPVQGIIEL